MVNRSDEIPEFDEIPDKLKITTDQEIQAAAMDILHEEAVERGDLPPAPALLFDSAFGGAIRFIFFTLAGGVIGLVANAAVLWITRSLAAI
ncbi:MAG: hypothetical protein QGH51_08120 [Planctomycetota bacterium]|jgi:hypothetical protein|nr:hypothetical protein [Planctomycetota bacterium]MDP6941973.1 hypothetical protein [Planctomycetota bacterium]